MIPVVTLYYQENMECKRECSFASTRWGEKKKKNLDNCQHCPCKVFNLSVCQVTLISLSSQRIDHLNPPWETAPTHFRCNISCDRIHFFFRLPLFTQSKKKKSAWRIEHTAFVPRTSAYQSCRFINGRFGIKLNFKILYHPYPLSNYWYSQSSPTSISFSTVLSVSCPFP